MILATGILMLLLVVYGLLQMTGPQDAAERLLDDVEQKAYLDNWRKK